VAIQTRQSPFIIPEATDTTDAGINAERRGYITPAATFINSTPTDAGGGEILLTSAGVHGLTADNAVGSDLYISSGTNWTTGFYPITDIAVDTTGTTIKISGTFVGGMGSPTIALAGTEVTFRTIAIPPIGPNGLIEIKPSFRYNNSANTKKVVVRFNGNAIYQPSVTTTWTVTPASVIVQNRNATNSQATHHNLTTLNGTGCGAVNALAVETSVDTSVATTITLGGQSNTANDWVQIEAYYIYVYK